MITQGGIYCQPAVRQNAAEEDNTFKNMFSGHSPTYCGKFIPVLKLLQKSAKGILYSGLAAARDTQKGDIHERADYL